MHIRQDLVFDKHMGEMIGFCNLGNVNEHLLQFERSLSEGDDTSAFENSPKLAKTMMVFMVRGLFSKLQFPYAQFPCADLSGEMLYEPFWEAVVCFCATLYFSIHALASEKPLIFIHSLTII